MMTSLAFFGEPRVPRLSKLLDEIRGGEIRVPRFQRPFIWTDEQRLALMESIYSGYPVGAILVWRTQRHRLSTHEHLGPIELPAEPEGTTTRQYLLDGHQRLTTLFTALGPGLYSRGGDQRPAWSPAQEEERRRWPVYFDLEFDRSEQEERGPAKSPFRLARAREQPPATWLPLDILLDSYSLREFEEGLRTVGYPKKIVNRVQSIADIFRDYTMPVMPIATEDLQQVTISFKRINSGGTPMSEVHMINALTHGPEFDFLARLEEVADELKSVGWEGFEQQMILNICKPRVGVQLYDEEPEDLASRLKADPDILGRVKDDIVKVAGVLSEITGVRGPASLPYSYQAVLLADALKDIANPSRDLLDRLRSWFWSTTLSEYFRGMSKSLFDRARRHLQRLVEGGADARPPDMPGFVERAGRFDFRSARSRGLSLLLAEQKPSSFGYAVVEDPFDLLAHHGSDALSKLIGDRDVPAAERELVHGAANRFLVHPKFARARQGLKT
ncbi:MAG: DUF262 domain-containing protein, partial [Polyangiaceae bacterium]|nr:DUF262 domain-containing protein [Polyangiaceae bacterium]